ncbi:MAG: TIGR00730 family Rossman fold protein [Paludibacteraceae bacterium]|nr:TIGR00730 family Rossman fold protein [Paludibacteraceae bacterium]
MNICVYCSAKDQISDDYKQLGAELGCWIAQNGHVLVFGGASGGLMTMVSRSAFAEGGQVIGIVPEHIERAGRYSEWCTERVRVKNMNERKQMMKDTADCFVCLPGSYGTLDEMFDVIASGTVGEHKKPIFIVNYKGFYDPLLNEIALMKEKSFIPQTEIYKPIFVDDIGELIDRINKLV